MKENCVSIFKSGECVPEIKSYTQVWIKLINQVERSRVVLTGAK